MPNSDNGDSSRITTTVGMILAANSSAGRSGLTSSCSSVPCSFSRTMAAAVSSIEIMVIMFSISSRLENQADVMLGLNYTRGRASTCGRPASSRCEGPSRRSSSSML